MTTDRARATAPPKRATPLTCENRGWRGQQRATHLKVQVRGSRHRALYRHARRGAGASVPTSPSPKGTP